MDYTTKKRWSGLKPLKPDLTTPLMSIECFIYCRWCLVIRTIPAQIMVGPKVTWNLCKYFSTQSSGIVEDVFRTVHIIVLAHFMHEHQ